MLKAETKNSEIFFWKNSENKNSAENSENFPEKYLTNSPSLCQLNTALREHCL